jgi:hypothetical protein
MLYAMRDERARVALAAEYERARGLSAALIASKYLAAGTTPPIPARDIAIIIESLGIGLGFQALIDPTGVSTDLEAVAVERILGPGPQPATPATPATPAVPTVPERPPKPARPKVPGPKKPKGR